MKRAFVLLLASLLTDYKRLDFISRISRTWLCVLVLHAIHSKHLKRVRKHICVANTVYLRYLLNRKMVPLVHSLSLLEFLILILQTGWTFAKLPLLLFLKLSALLQSC